MVAAVLRSPFGVGASGRSFAVECGKNVFDHVAGEQPVDRRRALHDRARPGRLGEGCKHAHRLRPCRSGHRAMHQSVQMECDEWRCRPPWRRQRRNVRPLTRNRYQARPACAAGTRWHRHLEKSRCRLRAWRKRNDHLQHDASRAPTRRRRRPWRCRRSARCKVCDSSLSQRSADIRRARIAALHCGDHFYRDHRARGCRRRRKRRVRRLRSITTRVTAASAAQRSSCARKRQHHGVRHGIKRLRPVQRDNSGGTAPLEQDFVARSIVHARHPPPLTPAQAEIQTEISKLS